jgi:transcriptional regulator with XRE-family HTH domain
VAATLYPVAGREIEVGEAGRRVAKAIQLTRQNKRMTLRDMAAALTTLGRPIGENSLGRMERGERRVDVDDLYAVAEVLEVPVGHLLEGRVDATVSATVHAHAEVAAVVGQAEDARVVTDRAVEDLAVRDRVIRDLAGRTPEEARRIAERLRGQIPAGLRPAAAAVAAARFDDFLTPDQREAVLRGSAEAAAEAARRAYIATAAELGIAVQDDKASEEDE